MKRALLALVAMLGVAASAEDFSTTYSRFGNGIQGTTRSANGSIIGTSMSTNVGGRIETTYYNSYGGITGRSTTTPPSFGGRSETTYYNSCGGITGRSTTTPASFGGSSTTNYYNSTGGHTGSSTSWFR